MPEDIKATSAAGSSSSQSAATSTDAKAAETQNPSLEAAKIDGGSALTKGMTTEGDAKAKAEGENKDAKAADGKEEKKEEKKEEAPKAPEKYEFKLPEGYQLPEDVQKSISESFKKFNIPQEEASKLVETHTKLVEQATNQMASKYIDSWKAQVTQWDSEWKSAKDIGGANYDKSVAVAQQALRTFGSPELIKLLDDGLGNNPVIGRFLYNIGSKLQEDTPVKASTDTAKAKSDAEILFGHLNKK